MKGSTHVRVRLAILAILVAFLGPPLASEAPAQERFPSRPITIIIPYGPGGGSDQLTRGIQPSLEKVLKVPIQAVNKPGGGGLAAIPDFMTAPADGYTVLQHIDDAATLYASGKSREHPGEDWIPVAIAQITFNQLYVRPDDARFPTWDAFVTYAKANPGKVTVANVGAVGSMERVAMIQIEKALGFKTTQVSFDKPAERYGALIGGHVDALFEQPGDVRSFLEANKMKAILTLLPERPKAFAEVAALKDIGVDISPLLRWRGFFVRKETPADRVKVLEKAFAEAWNSPQFQEFNTKQFMHLIVSYRDIAGARTLIGADVKTYREIYKELGLAK
jgi:tripartite-type tricarboxylate transporter receptor subunit TctC